MYVRPFPRGIGIHAHFMTPPLTPVRIQYLDVAQIEMKVTRRLQNSPGRLVRAGSIWESLKHTVLGRFLCSRRFLPEIGNFRSGIFGWTTCLKIVSYAEPELMACTLRAALGF